MIRRASSVLSFADAFVLHRILELEFCAHAAHVPYLDSHDLDISRLSKCRSLTNIFAVHEHTHCRTALTCSKTSHTLHRRANVSSRSSAGLTPGHKVGRTESVLMRPHHVLSHPFLLSLPPSSPAAPQELSATRAAAARARVARRLARR